MDKDSNLEQRWLGRKPWTLGEDKEGCRDGLKGVCGDGLRCALRSELVGGLGDWSSLRSELVGGVGDWSWLGLVWGLQVRRK